MSKWPNRRRMTWEMSKRSNNHCLFCLFCWVFFGGKCKNVYLTRRNDPSIMTWQRHMSKNDKAAIVRGGKQTRSAPRTMFPLSKVVIETPDTSIKTSFSNIKTTWEYCVCIFPSRPLRHRQHKDVITISSLIVMKQHAHFVMSIRRRPLCHVNTETLRDKTLIWLSG